MSQESFNLVAGGVAKQQGGQSVHNYPEIEEDFSLENFEKYIINSQQNWKELTEVIHNGEINSLSIRYSIWRILLRSIPLGASKEQMKEIIEEQRKHYQNSLEKFKFKADLADEKSKDQVQQQKVAFNPLAPKPKTTAKSNTVGVFDDQELKQDIKKDVERTYQDKEFFLNLKIKSLLTNILFVWSKLNPSISYRQGMNEIVASLIVIYFTESVYIYKNREAMAAQDKDSAEFAAFMIDIENAEADIFTLFSRIMEIGHAQMFVHDTKKKSSQPVLQRVSRIQDFYLKTIDIQLFRHLKLMNVEFSIFLLRWIRCIFTREYHMHDSFTIWDSIFLDYFKSTKNSPVGESKKVFQEESETNNSDQSQEKQLDLNNFFLIDCISLAMILYVRADVIDKDEGHECLQRYLKFPPVQSILTILQGAQKIKKLLVEAYDQQNSPEKKSQTGTAQVVRDKVNPLIVQTKKAETKSFMEPLVKIEVPEEDQNIEKSAFPSFKSSKPQNPLTDDPKHGTTQKQQQQPSQQSETKKINLGDVPANTNNYSSGSQKKAEESSNQYLSSSQATFQQQKNEPKIYAHNIVYKCIHCKFSSTQGQFILHCTSRHAQEVIKSCSQPPETNNEDLLKVIETQNERIRTLENQIQMMINLKKQEDQELE